MQLNGGFKCPSNMKPWQQLRTVYKHTKLNRTQIVNITKLYNEHERCRVCNPIKTYGETEFYAYFNCSNYAHFFRIPFSAAILPLSIQPRSPFRSLSLCRLWRAVRGHILVWLYCEHKTSNRITTKKWEKLWTTLKNETSSRRQGK